MFKDRLKALLEERGITVYRLALDLGLSGATPRHWMLRGSLPNAKNLNGVANYFGVSVKDLME